MFVASDFSYKNRHDCPQPFTRSSKYLGTLEFLSNLTSFSRKYSAFGDNALKYDQIYGRLKNAIILDAIMNYNNSESSQSFDNSSVTAGTLSAVYSHLKKNKMRGDFIAVVSNKEGWEDVKKMSSRFISTSEC